MDVLDELAAVQRRRRSLDSLELALIERAREGGLPWSRIAPALGVVSRQAAEQRFLRLSGSAGRDPSVLRRQRNVDESSGAAVGALRRAVRKALRQVLADGSWDGRHARAALARASLSMAEAAPPGAMFALAEAAVDDLSGLDLPMVSMLRSALEDARP